MNNPKVRSYICRKDGYIISVADVIGIMSEYLDHYVNSTIETVDQKDFDDVKKVLAYTCSMAPFMPADGIYGWTFSLPSIKRKIFSSLNKSDKTYVCRSHMWEPDKHENTPRVALQMFSEKQNLNRISLVDIENKKKSHDTIEKLMERYFYNEEKVEVLTMFTDDKLYILKPFPSCQNDVFSEISEKVMKDPHMVISRMETLEDFRFSFRCGCNSEKIAHIFSTLKKEDMDFLFKKDDTVTVECPRCGKKYEFKRKDICVE